MGIPWRGVRLSLNPSQVVAIAERLSQALTLLPHFPIVERRSLRLSTAVLSARESASQEFLGRLEDCERQLRSIGSTRMSGKRVRATILQALDLMEESARKSLLEERDLPATTRPGRKEQAVLLASTLDDGSPNVLGLFVLSIQRKRYHMRHEVRWPTVVPVVPREHSA